MTSQRDREHIFERLRSGVVPERGLEAFAVGVEKPRAEIGRLLDLAASGEGVFKFLRGGYGCGKTFMARLALLDAQARGFATSFVVVSDNDFHLHKFEHPPRPSRGAGQLRHAGRLERPGPRERFDNAKLKGLGWKPLVSTDEGVRRAFADFEANPK